MRSFIVVGLGRFGSEVARELCGRGKEVMAIDIRADMVQHVANDVTQAVVADSQDKEVLKALGAGNFDCAVVAIGEELGASVLAVMNLKELGVPYIVCKAHDETHRRVLEKLGADRVVIPEREYAGRLARSLASTNVLDYIELSNEYGIIEVPVPKVWYGKSLKELNVRANLGINILAIKKEGKTDVSPAADYKMEEKAIMLVLGDTSALEAVQKL